MRDVFRHLPGLAVACACVFLAVDTLAAAPGKGLTVDIPTLKGFQAPINEGNRMVALVSGREAKPSLVAGLVEVKDFKLETFRYAPQRETELIVESPLGVFGPSGAGSDQRISMRSSDGRFAIQGEGWNWNKATGLLVISNRVQTSLRRPGAATNRPPIELRARRFEYRMDTGDARFVTDCQATEPGQARLTAGELVSRLSVRTEKPTSIVATNGVTIELLRAGHEGRATGNSATYASTPAGEEIQLSGNPTWRFPSGEGTADLLVLRPATDSYAARGNARLRLQRPRPGTPAADGVAQTNSLPLEIACESIEGGPKEVVFTGPVVARQGDRLEVRAGRVVAEMETPKEGGQPRPAILSATGEVIARILAGRELVEIRGDSMRYELGDREVINVDGKPAWRAPTHAGSADRFVIHTAGPVFEADENVRVEWQAAGSEVRSNPVKLEAGRMRVSSTNAQFSGGVRAARDTWNLDATELDLLLSTNAAPREISARGKVHLEYEMPLSPGRTNDVALRVLNAPGRELTRAARLWRIDAAEVIAGIEGTNSTPSSIDATGGVRIENPGVKASGARLQFRAAEGLLRLNGEPELHTAAGLIIVGEPATSLALDPHTGRFQVDGRWRRMTMPAGALRSSASTNAPPRT